LNLAAGRKAKASAAYPSALAYFTVGAELLADSTWTEHYELAFALSLERAEAQYLCGRLQEAETGFVALLDHCRSALDRADVYALLMVEFETMSRYADAILAGLDGLRRLDVAISAEPAEWESALDADLDAIRRAIGARPIASLVDLPRVDDPRIRQAMRLLQAAWAPAYISGRTSSRPASCASRSSTASASHPRSVSFTTRSPWAPSSASTSAAPSSGSSPWPSTSDSPTSGSGRSSIIGSPPWSTHGGSPLRIASSTPAKRSGPRSSPEIWRWRDTPSSSRPGTG
jgi:hypothetical protein